jgi:hypothetical protein
LKTNGGAGANYGGGGAGAGWMDTAGPELGGNGGDGLISIIYTPAAAGGAPPQRTLVGVGR